MRILLTNMQKLERAKIIKKEFKNIMNKLEEIKNE
jgi:hypothetical protein